MNLSWKSCQRPTSGRKKYEKEYGVEKGEGAHTKENRLHMTRELGAQKEEKEKNERKRMGTEERPPREVPGVYNTRGEIRQCNEGKYDFYLDQYSDPATITFHLETPKFLTTDLMDVDVNPWYVRCVVKEKLTQLRLQDEVIPTTSSVQRSKTTGHLKIVMPRLQPGWELRKAEAEAPVIEPLKPKEDIASKKYSQPTSGVGINPANIISGGKTEHLKAVKGSTKIVRQPNDENAIAQMCQDDHPDVPPLEPIPVGFGR